MKDITGRRFARLLVISRSPRPNPKSQKAQWICRCDCGTQLDVVGDNLRTGNTRSCGCLKKELSISRPFKHGQSHTLAYRSWHGARSRCTDPEDPAYSYYGARGITFCARWDKFENFLADMGDRPRGRSLDRIDNDGNYEPDNCRWATRAEQRKNTRPALKRGQEVCCEKCGHRMRLR
jgi:hypothetical protein